MRNMPNNTGKHAPDSRHTECKVPLKGSMQNIQQQMCQKLQESHASFAIAIQTVEETTWHLASIGLSDINILQGAGLKGTKRSLERHKRQGWRADLGAHEDEAKGVDGSYKGVEHKAVPAAVGLVDQGPTSIANQDGVQHVAQVPDGIGIMPLGLTGTVVACHATSNGEQGWLCNPGWSTGSAM